PAGRPMRGYIDRKVAVRVIGPVDPSARARWRFEATTSADAAAPATYGMERSGVRAGDNAVSRDANGLIYVETTMFPADATRMIVRFGLSCGSWETAFAKDGVGPANFGHFSMHGEPLVAWAPA